MYIRTCIRIYIYMCIMQYGAVYLGIPFLEFLMSFLKDFSEYIIRLLGMTLKTQEMGFLNILHRTA